MKSNHLTTTILSDRSYSGDRYIATMSEARFKFLINCLRFDDRVTREQRLVGNKLVPISDIWEILLKNCRDNYKASSYVTIDEQLVGFRGNCSFRMYIPSKPNKYGIKIVEMCDNSTKYLLEAIIYVGKGTVEAGKPVVAALVNRLVESIKGSNRNVTMDNWFSSIPLVISMLNEKKLTVVCTVKQNKPEFPKDFTNSKLKNRSVGSSMFLFHEHLTAVSYKTKENKTVALLSSMHGDSNLDPSTKKPDIILTYNQTKGAVDTFDMMCNNMNCVRKTKRWPMCLFYNILNIAAINSYVIYVNNVIAKGGKPLCRLEFMLKLHEQLTRDWQSLRQQNVHLNKEVHTMLTNIIGEAIEEQHAPVVQDKKGRKYCSYCP